ncbi:nitrous oxide reductase family maturation protein NosD [Agromyces sp. NPDC057865]|uniref:right-handed parallel beta-helix repeat-containing protein n=1 Tax=Agromyces sp. NPDC057865 TaxID=3346267 RepID=UPI00366C92EC
MNDAIHTGSTRATRSARVNPTIVIVLVIVGLTVLTVGIGAIAWAVAQGAPAGDGNRAGAPATEEAHDAKGTASSAAPTPSADARCPEATVDVSSAKELEQALEQARPGDVIGLAPGRYEGEFVLAADGEAQHPITLCGTPESVLDGGGTDGGYVVHLDGASYVVLKGFAVENGQKGVMADATTHSVIRGLRVAHIGDEAIHLRGHSTDNQVLDNTISDTGLRKPKFGEGIYIGTAESNWCDISDCEPDASDRNLVQGNTISGTTSESVDIKEGTSGGVLRDNTFDGSAITKADSWVDVKGNGWLIEGNTGTAAPEDGFQTHEILDGWGTGNVFRHNTAKMSGSGVGFALEPERDNVVACDNTVSGGEAELSNVDCRE